MAPREHLLHDFRDTFDEIAIKLPNVKSIKSLSNIYTMVYICINTFNIRIIYRSHKICCLYKVSKNPKQSLAWLGLTYVFTE